MNRKKISRTQEELNFINSRSSIGGMVLGVLFKYKTPISAKKINTHLPELSIEQIRDSFFGLRRSGFAKIEHSTQIVSNKPRRFYLLVSIDTNYKRKVGKNVCKYEHKTKDGEKIKGLENIASHYGVSYSRIRRKMKNGASLEYALKEAIDEKEGITMRFINQI